MGLFLNKIREAAHEETAHAGPMAEFMGEFGDLKGCKIAILEQKPSSPGFLHLVHSKKMPEPV